MSKKKILIFYSIAPAERNEMKPYLLYKTYPYTKIEYNIFSARVKGAELLNHVLKSLKLKNQPDVSWA